MIIVDPEESLETLLRIIDESKEVTCVAFQIDSDPVATQIVEALNAKNATVYGQDELVIGRIGLKIKNLISNGSLHAKIFICDSTIISTDRNISSSYYGPDAIFESSDLIFESESISTALVSHLKSRAKDTFVMKDGDYTLIYGNIGDNIADALKRGGLRVASCIFMPTLRMQRILIATNAKIVTTSSEFMGEGFTKTLELVAKFMSIPGQTYIYPKSFHHKILLADTYAWHGSYNIDQVSEFYTKEQMVLTRNPDDVKALKTVMDDLFKESVVVDEKHVSYAGFIANMSLQYILRFWKVLA